MRELDSLLHSNRPLYTPICGPGILKRPSSRMLFVFRTIPLQAAFLPEVFCFLHVDLLPPKYLGLTIVRSFPEFFPPGTMTSADFLQFVVTTHFFLASARPPRVLTRSFPLYLPHLPRMIPCSYWALFCAANSPSFTALYAISVRQARVLPIGGPLDP
mgnify:CR=1 FL=1